MHIGGHSKFQWETRWMMVDISPTPVQLRDVGDMMKIFY